MRRLLLLALFLLCASGSTLDAVEPNYFNGSLSTIAPQTVPTTPLSPRLTALQQELGRGNRNALEYFWQEISRQGTPLVEPIVDGGAYVYVTFLWRGNSETKNVVVLTLDNSQLANAEYLAQA
ncbi:MAG TPA: hypothetical protein VGC66_14505 [Pyrinomonadaceae bacterium]|jgi:hypothetical protein